MQAAFGRPVVDHFQKSDHRLEESVANKVEQIVGGLLKLDQRRWDPGRPAEALRPFLPASRRVCHLYGEGNGRAHLRQLLVLSEEREGRRSGSVVDKVYQGSGRL